MARNDMELERYRAEMDEASRAIAQAKGRLDSLSARRDPIKREIESVKYNISHWKGMVSNEYDAVRYCRQVRDRLGADNHRFNAESYKQEVQRLYAQKEHLYDQLNGISREWEQAVQAKRDAQERKNRAREAFSRRLEYLKSQWKETRCRQCGGTVRYHADWPHVPSLCKECKEREKSKWREKPCKGCGSTIRYRTDWDHQPNFCKCCKQKHLSSRAGQARTC